MKIRMPFRADAVRAAGAWRHQLNTLLMGASADGLQVLRRDGNGYRLPHCLTIGS